MQRSGWGWFGLWALPGAALAFQVGVIGLLLLPAGFVGALLLIKRARVWPEILGMLEGFALVFYVFAYANRDYIACDDVRIRLHPGVVFDCGGTDPVTWFAVGSAFAVAGAAGYAALERRIRRRRA